MSDQTTEPRRINCSAGFDPHNAELQWMLRETEEWVAAILGRKEPYWLSLLGVSGTGKTSMARAAWREVYKIRTAMFRKWTAVLDTLRDGDFGIKGALAAAPVVFLDDLAAGHETRFSQSAADEIADRRIGKWTIWTSNLTLAQVGDHLSHRVRTRMKGHGNRVVEILKTTPYCDR